MALMMVGFLLGGRLHLKTLRDDGPQVIWISVCAALGAAILVTTALLAIGLPRELAILLGCVAAATAPAASLEIHALDQIGPAAGVFLLARVAGKLLGAWGGARVSGAGIAVERWVGLAVLPQAGVAIGMACKKAARRRLESSRCHYFSGVCFAFPSPKLNRTRTRTRPAGQNERQTYQEYEGQSTS